MDKVKEEAISRALKNSNYITKYEIGRNDITKEDVDKYCNKHNLTLTPIGNNTPIIKFKKEGD